ncbi:hypothetical protein [Variovorax paradoxus]|uniref:hypothetical protein n=1 Tax=Variovorax paradoxus TaxID=34073 RepID=UPI001292E80F|nr:hypothetical protein [Variovorax paradoxus]
MATMTMAITTVTTITTIIEPRRGRLSMPLARSGRLLVRETLMDARAHRAGQAALEHAVDFFHLAPRSRFAVDGAQRDHHVLAQVPEGFHIDRKAHALTDTLNRLAAAALEHRQHRGADAAELTFSRLPRSQAGYVQKLKKAAKEQHVTKSVLPGTGTVATLSLSWPRHKM